LYKALSPDGNPEFATVLRVVRALGLRLHAATSRKKAKGRASYRGRSRRSIASGET
jgi:hypothetical protein